MSRPATNYKSDERYNSPSVNYNSPSVNYNRPSVNYNRLSVNNNRQGDSYSRNYNKVEEPYSPTLYRWDDAKDDKSSDESSRRDNKWYRGDYQDEFRETHDYYSLDVVEPQEDFLKYDYS